MRSWTHIVNISELSLRYTRYLIWCVENAEDLLECGFLAASAMELPTELSGISVKDRAITQPKVILIIPSPPSNVGIFGASVPYTNVRWPTRFVSMLREPGRCVSSDARASVSIKEAFEVGFEPVS